MENVFPDDLYFHRNGILLIIFPLNKFASTKDGIYRKAYFVKTGRNFAEV